MTRHGIDLTHGFDVEDPRFNAHYEDVVQDLVETCPVAHSPVGRGYWVVSRYDDIREMAKNWEVFSAREGMFPNRPSFDDMPPLLPPECDPPEHAELRRGLNKYFTVQGVNKYRDEVRKIADALLDEIVETDRCDIVSAFTWRFPGSVVLETFLGVPGEDMAYLKDVLNRAFVGPVDGQAEAVGQLTAYVEGYLRSRETEPPRGDVVDAVLQLVDPDGAPLEFWKKRSVVSTLITGGLETTSNLMAGSVHHLATHPEDQQRLRTDRSLIPQAVEEFLRFYMPVFGMLRTATADVAIQGQDIKSGDSILLSWASACRDPQLFAEPRSCDIDRWPNPHVAFGLGVHRCIGAHLARLMGVTALERILDRLDDIELDGPIETRTGYLRNIHRVPIRYRQSPPDGL